jgi:hypothetical protein
MEVYIWEYIPPPLKKYNEILFVYNDLRWEVAIRLVDIGGIVDHNYLSFLFIVKKRNEKTNDYFFTCSNLFTHL